MDQADDLTAATPSAEQLAGQRQHTCKMDNTEVHAGKHNAHEQKHCVCYEQYTADLWSVYT